MKSSALSVLPDADGAPVVSNGSDISYYTFPVGPAITTTNTANPFITLSWPPESGYMDVSWHGRVYYRPSAKQRMLFDALRLL